MDIKCVLFAIDDILYDTSLQMSMARLNAIKAMNEAGLPTDIETAYRILDDIVKEFGRHYNRHFNILLERLGLKWDPRVIAAGVAAYRETSSAYLKPFSDTVPVLLKLREMGYRLGIISEGIAVKQWQKLIQLGVQHLFHYVLVSEEINTETMTPELFRTALKELDIRPEECIFIGNRLDTHILYANEIDMVSIRIRKGEQRIREPESPGQTPSFEITKLSEILDLLENQIISPIQS